MRRLIKPLLGLLGRIAVIVAASLALLAFMMQEYVLGCILLLLVTMVVINNLQLIVTNLKTRLKDLEGKKEQDKAEINLLNSKLSLFQTIDNINKTSQKPVLYNKNNYVTGLEAALLLNVSLKYFYAKYRKDPNFPKPIAIKQGLTIPKGTVLFDKEEILQFAKKIKIIKNQDNPNPVIKVIIEGENYINVGAICEIFGICPSTFYLRYRQKRNFPKPIKRMVHGFKKRHHLYKETEILQYKQRYV